MTPDRRNWITRGVVSAILIGAAITSVVGFSTGKGNMWVPVALLVAAALVAGYLNAAGWFGRQG